MMVRRTEQPGQILARTRDLAPRRLPTQSRAKDTVEKILSAAAELLEEGGLGAFNTNLLAQRAEVRVRTVYRYFPNKLAVITALAERMTALWDGWFDGFRALADPESDWDKLWDSYIDTFVDGLRLTPGGLAIRRAMRALPELQIIDRQDNERLARELAAALKARGVAASHGRLLRVSRVLIETAVAVLDLVLLEPGRKTNPFIEELKKMHRAYIEEFVE